MIKKLSITTNMKNMTGLTLVEILVTLAVVAILAAVGLPNISKMTSGNRMTVTINKLSADLAFAKSEAIKRNEQVDVIANTSWDQGWTVEDASGNVLRESTAIPSSMTLSESGGSSVTTVSYGSDGLNATMKTVSLSAANIQFVLCEPDKKDRIITINTAGRLSTYNASSVSSSCP